MLSAYISEDSRNTRPGGRTVHSHLPLVLQVALVGHDNDWERVLVLYTQNLLVEGADFLERVARSDGVDQEEPLARAHVLLAHGTARGHMSGGRGTRTRMIGRTRIPLDQQCPGRRGARPRRQSRIVSGTNLVKYD